MNVITFSSSLNSKKVKLNGVVTEDRMTGDRLVTHMTVMEDMIGAGQPESDQKDPQNTATGTFLVDLRRDCCAFVRCREEELRMNFICGTHLKHGRGSDFIGSLLWWQR